MMNTGKLLFFLSLLWMMPLSATAQNASADKLKIERLQKELQADLREKQAVRQQTEQTLEKTGAELNKLNRELEQIIRRRQTAWDTLSELQDKLTALQAEIGNGKAQVARLLTANYKNRQPNAVYLFLKDFDANQKSRFLHYARKINEGNAQVIARLSAQEAELAEQEQAVAHQVARLNELAKQHQAAIARIGKTRSDALAENEKLSREITKRQQKLAQLRHDETGLGKIVSDIAARENAQKRLEAQEREQAARQKTEEALKRVQQQQQKQTDSVKEKSSGSIHPDETKTHSAPKHPADMSRRQGRLPMPVNGAVKGRFGAKRSSGGTWKGLFIETAPAVVRSVAFGQVEYAKVLPGYGQTVVINHGNNYMSIYSGLSRIGVREGTAVAVGQDIGTSGTLPQGEQGLYFQLRYRQRPVNPKSWLK